MTNKEIVKKVNEAFVKGKTEDFLMHCAENIEWTMIGDRKFDSKEAIRKFMKEMGSEPMPSLTIDYTVSEGDRVVSTGSFDMPDREGKIQRYQYCEIYRFQDGKIAELTSFASPTQ